MLVTTETIETFKFLLSNAFLIIYIGVHYVGTYTRICVHVPTVVFFVVYGWYKVQTEYYSYS